MFTIRSRRVAPNAAAAGRLLRAARRAVVQIAVLCLITCGFAVAEGAERLAPDEKRAIEQTIRSQLDAFGREDADGAFNFASPDIQRMFRSSDAFMDMVRDHYEPVYRAASTHFVKLESVGGQWVQTVQIVDGEGRVWRASFTMRRQPDKSWKVGGCQLVQTSAIAT